MVMSRVTGAAAQEDARCHVTGPMVTREEFAARVAARYRESASRRCVAADE